MTDYTFDNLNDKEFEIFCADLLSQVEGARFERFKSGKDGGIDGRYFSPGGKEIILQCKHWVRTPIEKLIKHLEEKEKSKLDRINPARYMLALSNPLSRADKDRIKAVLGSHLKSAADIFGREDLNDLLSHHSEIEKRHYKLWLGSTHVLSHLINKPLFDRSSFTLEEIISDAKRYVPTASHDLALQKLEKQGVVLITGEAGIGKTTLADHLCLHYVTNDFEFLKIGDEIREAEAAFNLEKKQIFYFDDFLGRNYLEALSGHEGSRIVQFMRRVVNDKTKRFILTSRTTILNQGKVLIDNFQHQKIERNEFELTVGSLSDIDRAKILYSHIWHSSLEADYVDVLYAERRYREVIQHRNYNPRLISYITDSDRLANCTADAYWAHVKAMLQNPAAVWENPFNAQHDDYGRALILLVTLAGRSVSETELSQSLIRFSSLPENRSMNGKRDFLINLRHLAGSMLTRELKSSTEGEASINLFNPSIGDYVLRRYANDIPTLKAAFFSLRSRASLNTLTALEVNKLLTPETARQIFFEIAERAINQNFVGFSSEYIAKVFQYLNQGSRLSSDIALACLNFISTEDCPYFITDAAEAVVWGFEHRLLDGEATERFLEDACTRNPISTELEILGRLLKLVETENGRNTELREKFESSVVSYLESSVHNEFDADDVFGDTEPEDRSSAQQNLENAIAEKLDEFGVEADINAVEKIAEAYDFDEQHELFFAVDDGTPPRLEAPKYSAFHIDEIDDLFHRDQQ